MKGRESGMPEAAYWSTFFDAGAALESLLRGGPVVGDVVEFGCGYGTFTVPMAKRTDGIVTALDIDTEMIAATGAQAEREGVTNIRTELRDFVVDGTALPEQSQSHAMIYNLLHIEDPLGLLREAHRVLADGGTISVMHWRSDIETPRGPSLKIRPTPQQCVDWLIEAGFDEIAHVDLSGSCPYHFGVVAKRS